MPSMIMDVVHCMWVEF